MGGGSLKLEDVTGIDRSIRGEQLYALLVLPEILKGRSLDQYKSARRAAGLIENCGVSFDIDLRKIPTKEKFYSEDIGDWFGTLKFFDLLIGTEYERNLEPSMRGEEIILNLVDSAYSTNPYQTKLIMKNMGVRWKDYSNFSNTESDK